MSGGLGHSQHGDWSGRPAEDHRKFASKPGKSEAEDAGQP